MSSLYPHCKLIHIINPVSVEAIQKLKGTPIMTATSTSSPGINPASSAETNAKKKCEYIVASADGKNILQSVNKANKRSSELGLDYKDVISLSEVRIASTNESKYSSLNG
jgi:hypothetical protein